MQVPLDFADTAYKLLAATVLSGVLGIERERKRRAAGLRTIIVVCLASTLAVIISNRMAQEWLTSSPGHPLDRGRIIAGILQGIGFLGAGAIITVNNIHRGLTTAAMIWFVAVMGVAVGLGYYIIAIVSTGFALGVVMLLEPLSEMLSAHHEFSLTLRMPGGPKRVRDVERFIVKQGYHLDATQLIVRETEDSVEARFSVATRRRAAIEELIELLTENFKDIRQIAIER